MAIAVQLRGQLELIRKLPATSFQLIKISCTYVERTYEHLYSFIDLKYILHRRYSAVTGLVTGAKHRPSIITITLQYDILKVQCIN